MDTYLGHSFHGINRPPLNIMNIDSANRLNVIATVGFPENLEMALSIASDPIEVYKYK